MMPSPNNIFINLIEEFIHKFSYYLKVDDTKEYYYYERIIRNMDLNNDKWGVLAVPVSYELNDNEILNKVSNKVSNKTYTVLYGFTEKNNLLYFKLAVVKNEKSK